MREKATNILFLCTGNSARSVLAEALLNHYGKPDFRGFSAGSQPKGTVHPNAVQVLHNNGITAAEFRSKSWDEFAGDSAPSLDVVITVCDNAAAEVCPVWPAHPMKVHWSIKDPAAATGSESEIQNTFNDAFTTIKRCILNLIDTMQQDTTSENIRKQLNEFITVRAT